jgi:nucleotide-binding universal stress UspA family protein
MDYQKIVLGYDESEAAKLALERAARIAKAFGSELIVTSVAPVVRSIGRSAGPIDTTDPPAAHIEELGHAKTYLEREGLQAELIPALGDPAETIADLAKEHDADLIVVGTHEPSLIGRLFGQSVTEAVVHKVHCDVLIVHPGHD